MPNNKNVPKELMELISKRYLKGEDDFNKGLVLAIGEVAKYFNVEVYHITGEFGEYLKDNS